MERKPADLEKISENHTPDKGVVSKIFKEFLGLNKNNPIKNGQRFFKFTKKDI